MHSRLQKYPLSAFFFFFTYSNAHSFLPTLRLILASGELPSAGKASLSLSPRLFSQSPSTLNPAGLSAWLKGTVIVTGCSIGFGKCPSLQTAVANTHKRELMSCPRCCSPSGRSVRAAAAAFRSRRFPQSTVRLFISLSARPPLPYTPHRCVGHLHRSPARCNLSALWTPRWGHPPPRPELCVNS